MYLATLIHQLNTKNNRRLNGRFKDKGNSYIYSRYSQVDNCIQQLMVNISIYMYTVKKLLCRLPKWLI